MQVTKQMVHPDLQSRFGALKFMASLMKRRWFLGLTNKLSSKFVAGRDIKGLDCEQRFVESSDGSWRIRVRIYRPQGHDGELPALLYIHGGGYITGLPESVGAPISQFIETRPCVIIAPDYRKAFTEPFPAGFNDCYETLLWAQANAAELNIRADKFMVAGHSAGGGLTAAVTLKARDTQDVNIAFQMPIYPMIDDQQPDDAARAISSPVWDTELNRIGWAAYLAGLRERGEPVPAYAAPARNTDYTGFPPTISFVGTLEPFYQEDVAYAQALRDAGVDVAFKEYPDCFHAFDFLGEAGVSQDALNFTYDSFAAFYDRYL